MDGWSTLPEQEGMDKKALLEMKALLKEGTCSDGLHPQERERMTALMAGRQPIAAAACEKGAEDDRWQASNLTSSLRIPRVLTRSCRHEHNFHIHKLWHDVDLLLLLGASHLFWDQNTRGPEKRSRLALSEMPSSSGMNLLVCKAG